MSRWIDQTYVINMDREHARLKEFDEMMGSSPNEPWSYLRFPAINGRHLLEGVTTNYRESEDEFNLNNCEHTVDHDREDILSMKKRCLDSRNLLTPGEIGCLLSHVKLWEFVANSSDMNRIAIFEDDARTHTATSTIFGLIDGLYSHLLDNEIDEPDMLYLGKALDACTKYEHVWGNVFKTKHPLCLHAYIISKKGARKLLRDCPYDCPIDMIPIHAAAKESVTLMTFHHSLYFQDILKNKSSLRELGAGLNLTSECLVEQSHINGDTMKYTGIVLVGFFAVLILFLAYVFHWSNVEG